MQKLGVESWLAKLPTVIVNGGGGVPMVVYELIPITNL